MKKTTLKIVVTFIMYVDLLGFCFIPEMVGAEVMKSIVGLLIYWVLMFVLVLTVFIIYKNR